ncbi:MAG TPA: hypothetical protein VE258_12130, partial [Ktedonobacterales bacterium]|nr:hypothetical protein [Ktedonobacterales bacterium]
MDTLLFWHGVLVECGVALGIEAALLLGLAVLAQRPRVERLAALLPAAGNMLAFTLARNVQASADEWQRSIAFQFAQYDPTYWRTFNRDNAQALADAVAAAQRSGIALLLLSEVLLFFGAFCILAWLRPPAWLKRLAGGRAHVVAPQAQAVATDV